MSFRHNWRGINEWRDEGLPIRSSSSDQAIKLYDAALTQFIGWYDEPNLGGLPQTLTDMISADPNFVLGRAFNMGLELIGTSRTIRLDNELKSELQALNELAKQNKDNIEMREFKHVEAVTRFANGDMTGAAQVWEDILVDNPTDLQALKFAHDTYFFLGKQTQLRDSIARVLPVWQQKSLPLKDYMHGMYAFGLEETHFYAKAEREAKRGLEKIPNDGWATHALAHVLEMEGRTQEGIKHMSTTVNDWQVCNYLACHNYWHWALYHIQQEEYEAAIQLFETQIGRRALERKMMLDIVDAASLLYRLDLVKPKSLVTSDHWEDIYSIVEPHLKDHILGFNDAHFVMACLGSNHHKEAQEILETLKPEDTSDLWVKVTLPLLEAIIAYNEEHYSKTVETLNNIRYDIVNIGGSDAQRDVFNQLLIFAALKSPLECHKRLSQRLLAERNSLKDNS